jgi:hypothetical protein
MKDILQDIVSHTQKIGLFNIVKVTGTEEKTTIEAVTDDRTVVLQAETTDPQPEFMGLFGMPQLEKLRYLLDGKEYQEDAKISLIKDQRNGQEILTGLSFENKDGDFKNSYRFMSSEYVNEKLQSAKFKGANWDVTVSPTLNAIQRFSFQAGANSEHTRFVARTEDNALKFVFGDQGSHAGEFVFATEVTGKITKAWAWPINAVLSILKSADTNNTSMSFSNQGAMQITLDSGLGKYKYIIPALV